MTRRLALVAHYDPDDVADPHFRFFLRALVPLCARTLVVSTSRLKEQTLEGAEVLTRDNSGYDFMSWKVGLKHVGSLDGYDELVLCNDSVYGPLQPLGPLFERMAGRADYWGITESREGGKHLQSYFLVFARHVFTSESFRRFWQLLRPAQNKNELVQDGELGLHSALREFRSEAVVHLSARDYASIIKRNLLGRIGIGVPASRWPWGPVNPLHVIPERLVLRGAPFVKVDLFRHNPRQVKLARVESAIRRASSYDARLIAEHTARRK